MGSNASGFSPCLLPDNGSGHQAAGFEFYTMRRGPDNSFSKTTRFDWGLFVGTKGRDLANPSAVQNINLQMNLHGGFNLNKIHRYVLTFPDPPGGYGGLYNNASLVQGIIARLRNGPDASNYYRYLYNAESTARPLVDMWADATGSSTHKAVASASSWPTPYSTHM